MSGSGTLAHLDQVTHTVGFECDVVPVQDGVHLSPLHFRFTANVTYADESAMNLRYLSDEKLRIHRSAWKAYSRLLGLRASNPYGDLGPANRLATFRNRRLSEPGNSRLVVLDTYATSISAGSLSLSVWWKTSIELVD
jgi:hypothetical protein